MSSLQKAKKMVEYRHNDALRKAQDIRQELLKDPDFKTAENKLGGLDFERSRREVYSLDTKEIDMQIAKVMQDRDNALKALGYTADILEPVFECKVCNDTGIARHQVCVCVEQERVKLEFLANPELHGVARSLADIDFSVYEQNKGFFQGCARYLEHNFIKTKQPSIMTLMGATGVGKSYLAKVVLTEYIYNGEEVLFINAIKLNKMFLEYHLAPLENKKEILKKVNSCHALVIDDLGVEPIFNNVTVPYLYELIIERAAQKTIITTNLSLRDLENRYGQRIFSRLMDKEHAAAIRMQGPDLRLSLG